MTSPLPYDTTPQDSAYFSQILINLSQSIKQGDFTQGATYWTKQLSLLLNLKHKPSPTARRDLVLLYFTLITTHTLNYSTIELFCAIGVKLLKPKDLNLDLVLDWRLLYNLVERIMYPKSRDRLMSGSISAANSISTFSKSCRKFVFNNVDTLHLKQQPRF